MEDRGLSIKEELIGNDNPDDITFALLEVFTETELVPEVGKYYTFVYSPKTENLYYDQYPLIACLEIFQWGFRGLNFHWGKERNYTWQEIQGSLHIIKTEEIMSVRSLPYAQYLINN